MGGVLIDGGSVDVSTIDTVAERSPSYHCLRSPDIFGHQGYLMKARAETPLDTGTRLSPFNAYILIQGLETLSVRMNPHVANAQTVAGYLDDHTKVQSVAYSGLSDDLYHDRGEKNLPHGAGASFTAEETAPLSGAYDFGF